MRLKLILILGALALVVAGCGGGEDAAPLPDEVEGTVPADTAQDDDDAETATEEEPADDDDGGDDTGDDGEGDPERGLAVFASAGCGGCHVLEEAGGAGTVGPNLDEADPDYEEAVEVITNGRGAMPAFGDQLDEQQIRDVAALVSDD